MDQSRRNFLTQSSTLIATAGIATTLTSVQLLAAENTEQKMPVGNASVATPTMMSTSGNMLTLAPGATTSELCLNWYSDSEPNLTTVVKIIEKTNPGNMVLFEGTFGEASEGKIWHKAVVTGLMPNTIYSYCISNNRLTFGEMHDYKTPATDQFSFCYVGDPQLTTGAQDKTSVYKSSDGSTREGWIETLDVMTKHYPEITFIAGVGDQVNNHQGDEAEYANFFAPAQLRNIPFAPAVGNHDKHYLFLHHYNIPNEIPFTPIVNDNNLNNIEVATAEAAAHYYYLYNNALFVVLNTSAYPDSADNAMAYINRFNKVLSIATQAHSGQFQWLFVQHHKSTASVAQHVADRDIQYYVEAGFEKLMDHYSVDFVLAGHDHVYARSFPMRGGKVAQNSDGNRLTKPDGTIYFTGTTASGFKYYNVFDKKGLYIKDNIYYPYLVKNLVGSQAYLEGNLPLSSEQYKQDKTPGFIKVDVAGNKVTFNTYDTNHPTTAIDSLVVMK